MPEPSSPESAEGPLALREWGTVLCALMGLTLLVHLSGLWGYFLADDWFNVRWMTPDSNLLDLLWGNWQFGERLSQTQEMAIVPSYLYRPIPRLSFLADRWVWGLEFPTGFHLTNILLHGLNVFFLFGVAWTLFRTRLIAWSVALVFLFHPLTVEAAQWVSARTDLWASLFSLPAIWLTLVCTGDKPFAKRRFLTLPLTALALMSKETTVTLPVMLLAIDFWRHRGWGSRRILWWGMNLALLMWYFIQRKIMFDAFTGHQDVTDVTILYPLYTMGRFLLLCAGPWEGRHWPAIVGFAVLYAAHMVVIFKVNRRGKVLALFGLGWVLLAFLPLMAIDYNIVVDNLRVNTRLLYPAMAGICLLAGVVLTALNRRAVVLTVGLALVCMLPSTIQALMGWARASQGARHTVELILASLEEDPPEGIVWLSGFPEREGTNRAFMFREVDLGQALMMVAEERGLDLPVMANGPMLEFSAEHPDLVRLYLSDDVYDEIGTMINFIDLHPHFRWRVEREDMGEEPRTLDFIAP